MPKCECPDWLQTFLPCKHFLSKHDRCKTKDVAIILYCSCRMPWQKADDSDAAMQMAQCDNCLEWFHHCCEKIPDNIFVNNLFWEYYKCQKRLRSLHLSIACKRCTMHLYSFFTNCNSGTLTLSD